jgi:predicted transcriptional regulator
MAQDDPYVTVRLPRELVERIDALAAARDWTRRHWVIRALERVAAGEERT